MYQTAVDFVDMSRGNYVEIVRIFTMEFMIWDKIPFLCLLLPSFIRRIVEKKDFYKSANYPKQRCQIKIVSKESTVYSIEVYQSTG